jgi:hypothetical protein
MVINVAKVSERTESRLETKESNEDLADIINDADPPVTSDRYVETKRVTNRDANQSKPAMAFAEQTFAVPTPKAAKQTQKTVKALSYSQPERNCESCDRQDCTAPLPFYENAPFLRSQAERKTNERDSKDYISKRMSESVPFYS